MTARTVTITGLGDFRQLQAELERTGVISAQSNKSIADSAARAGEAAAAQAKEMGASADEQETAAARAAAAYVDGAARMTQSQKAAALAAATTADASGKAADEIVAASARAVEAQKAIEEASLHTAATADAAGVRLGTAFDEGTSKAGNALTRLGEQGASWGIPFAGSLTTAGKHLDEAETKTGKLTTVMGELGKVSLIAGGAIAVGVGVEAVKMGMQYESAQAKIQGATQQSNKEVKALTSTFEQVGKFVMTSGEEAETAFAGVAGQLQATEGHALGTAAAVKVMTSAVNLNDAVQGNLAQTTGALSTVMQAFHLSTDQAAGTADTLYNISTRLDVPIGTLTTGMDKLHARLGTLSPTLSDMGGLMVSLGEHGVQGSRGIQVVSTAMSTLVGGSEKTTEVLKDLGVNIFNSQGKFIGMKGVIEQLGPKLDGLSQKNQIFAEKTLFGAGAYQVMGSVIQSGVGAYQKATDAATKTGSAQAAAARQAETLHGEFETAKAAIETFAGVIGLELVPELKLMEKELSESIQWMEKHKAVAYALGGVITGVLGLAVSVFAYQKAVAFVKGTQEMVGGVVKLASTVEQGAASMIAKFTAQGAAAEVTAEKVATSNATIEGDNVELADSYGTTAGAAETAGTGMVASAEGTAAKVAEANSAMIDSDGALVTANEAVGASFTAIGGAAVLAAGVVYGAVKGMEAALKALTGEAQNVSELLGGNQPGEKGKEGESYAKSHGGYGTAAFAAQRSVASLQNLGIGGNAAQGVVKALMAETQGNLEKGAGEEGKEGAYGIAQWLGSRREGLEKFAKGKKEPKSNLEVQLEYLAKELKGPEHGTLTALQHAHGVNEASGIFIKQFERPEVPSTVEKRASGYSVPSSNKALQEQMEEASGARPKKKEREAAALGVPTAVATMLATAQALLGTKYTSGGGHGSSANDPIEMLKKIGVDCSGFVSRVLASGGLPTTGLTTEGLASSSALAKGAGRYVSVYDRANAGGNSHTLIDVLGKWFESGGNPKYNPKGGVSMLTAAQAAGELSSGGFQAYHPAGLNAPVKGGKSESEILKGTGLTAAEAVSKLIETAQKKLEEEAKKLLETNEKGTESLLKKYETNIQSSTPAAIEKSLGISTTGKYKSIPSDAERAAKTGKTGPLETELSKSAGASEAGKQEAKLVSGLKATHQKGLEELASELVAAHKDALATLAAEMVSTEQTKLGEQLKVQATEEKDRTTLAEHSAADQLNVVKAEQAQQTDAMKSAATMLGDATQSMSDSFSALTQSIEDQSKVMAAASNEVVQGIKDQTNIEVAILGERGLYGLNLIAQKEEVQLDEMKASYDQQIAQAQREEAQLAVNWQQVTALDEQTVDQDKAQADAVEAAAQAHLDSVTVTQDQRIAAAQATVDAAQLHADQLVGNAELKVLAATNAGKKKEEEAAAGLKLAEGQGEKLVKEKEANLKGSVEPAANTAINAAQNALTQATESYANAIKQAEQNLAKAKGESAEQLANAQQKLQSIEDKAAQAEAAKEKEVSVTKEEASTQYAGSGLTIQQYGIDFDNATAAANEAVWALTHQLPV